MESPLTEKTSEQASRSISTSSSTNQLFITDNLDLPDDTFRKSLDNFSVVGENVTIDERDVSLDINVTNSNVNTPINEITTPRNTPCTETPPSKNSPPIIETPKKDECNTNQARHRPQDLLKLSLVNKNTDSDVFVKPSPMMEVMSPAKMLQFKINTAGSATPTMKRAAIDFDFFNKNNFEEYFDDVPKNNVDDNDGGDTNDACTKTAVIVKADTVRHEIGYGKYLSVTYYTINAIYNLCK